LTFYIHVNKSSSKVIRNEIRKILRPTVYNRLKNYAGKANEMIYGALKRKVHNTMFQKYVTSQGFHDERIATAVALATQQLRHAKKPTISPYPSNGNRIQCDGSGVGAQEGCENICKQMRLKKARALRAEM
jgi:hypothetical protein